MKLRFVLWMIVTLSFVQNLHAFEIKDGFIKMQDGVQLSVTYYFPNSTAHKRPILFELLPYRKDDFFKARDYEHYAYFVNRGFIVARVDVRGTGSSQGQLPDREYSDQELQDAIEVIHYLSQQSWSCGQVVMMGISWSGFNAIQVAMKQPKGLIGILAVDATDDLYHDDIHYLDGILHYDEYHLSINHDNGFPASPDYKIDEAYVHNRFEVEPWILRYLREQRDGPFWQSHSLLQNYDAIQVPVFLIGGLLDGYRDSVPRMVSQLKVPTVAIIGPWNHAWPDNGEPKPVLEWRPLFIHWIENLTTQSKQTSSPKQLLLFVRDTYLPDISQDHVPGHWRTEDWPIQQTNWHHYFLHQNHILSEELPLHSSQNAWDTVTNHPTAGLELGDWWGELTPDMRPFDAHSLTYDSTPLTSDFEIIGHPVVTLKVASSVPLTHWVVRLEDIHPSGEVSLVTGAAINGSQLFSRLNPQNPKPNAVVEFKLPLHFTTWTYRAGHRIRLAISNGAFPMLWPSPNTPTAKVYVNTLESQLQLPTIPVQHDIQPAFSDPEPRPKHPFIISETEENIGPKRTMTRSKEGWYSVENSDTYTLKFPDKTIRTQNNISFSTYEPDPSQSRFKAQSRHLLTSQGGRTVEYSTHIAISSDINQFTAHIRRQIFENEQLIREKHWNEIIPRQFQ